MSNGGRPGGIGIPHGPRCDCSLCKPRLDTLMTGNRYATKGHIDIFDSRDMQIKFDKLFETRTFDEAMREVHALRAARLESHWKLFRLSLCQSAILRT